jgi:alanyl-tRNA synthetase
MFSRDGQLAVTHFFSPSYLTHRTFFFPLRVQNATNIGFLNTHAAFRMGSSIETGPKWTADRVRETFLGYFKKQGHTFGRWDTSAIL